MTSTGDTRAAKSRPNHLPSSESNGSSLDEHYRFTRFAPISPISPHTASAAGTTTTNGGFMSAFARLFVGASTATTVPQSVTHSRGQDTAFAFPTPPSGSSSVGESGRPLEPSAITAANQTTSGSVARKTSTTSSTGDVSLDLPSPTAAGNMPGNRGQYMVRKISKAGGFATVTSKLSKVLKKPGQTDTPLLDYNRSDFRQYWMPDSRGKECYECQEKFTTFRRRHHCRICGQIFCSKCCNSEVPGQFLGYMGDLRLCTYCCNTVIHYLDNNPSSGANEDGSSRTADNSIIHDVIVESEEASSTAGGLGAASLLDDTVSRSATGGTFDQSSRSLAGVDSINVISSGRIWPEASTKEAPTSRHASVSRNNSLRVPSKGDPKEPSVLSVVDLKVIAPDDINGANPNGQLFVNTLDEWEPEWVKNIDIAKEPKETVSTGPSSIDTAAGRSKASLSDISENLGGSRKALATATDSLPLLPLLSLSQSRVSPTSYYSADPFDSPTGVIDKEQMIGSMFETQAVKLLSYVLKREGLSRDRWLRVLWPLCQEIAYTVQPNVRERADDMDILQYIHVKMALCVPEQQQPYAQVVFGTVCSKAVTDSRMQQRFRRPSVLVMSGAIEYERVEGRFSSIDPIIAQEMEHLRGTVSRISSRGPNILVVEKSVARIAKHFILKKGITLVSGLKPHVLKRIARCTQADVVQAAEAQITKPKMGTCGSFKTETLHLLNGDVKTLMYFEDCQPDLSCSVVLYGGNVKELRAVKKVFRFMISVLHSAKLEKDLVRSSQVCLYPQEHGDELIEEENKSVCSICTANYSNLLQPKRESYDCELTRSSDVDTSKELSPSPSTPSPIDEHCLSDLGEHCTLTASPFLLFGLPFLETDAGRPCKLLTYFKQPLYRFNPRLVLDGGFAPTTTAAAEDASPDSRQSANEVLPPRRQLDATALNKPQTLHPFVRHTGITGAAPQLRAEMAAYRANGGRLFRRRLRSAAKAQRKSKVPRTTTTPATQHKRKRNRVPSGPIDILSPYNHQRIAVLFGSYSPKSPNAPLFCVRPWVVWMEFYGMHDMPLGEFLKRYCFNPDYRCPSPNCDVTMLDHLRKIVHRNAAIEISIQAIMESGVSGFADQEHPVKQLRMNDVTDDRILTWDWCVRCKVTTNASPLSNEMWHMSFAKYLDYLLNGRHLQSHIVNTSTTDGTLESRPCPHCLFHEHDHYFVLNNYISCLKVTRVQLFEVTFSPMVCYIDPMPPIPVMPLANTAKDLSELAGSIFGSVLEGIKRFDGHKDCNKYPQIAAAISQIYEERTESFRQLMSSVQEALSSLSPVRSRQISRFDANFLKAADGLVNCRQILSIAILEWNQNASELLAAVKLPSFTQTRRNASAGPNGGERTHSMAKITVSASDESILEDGMSTSASASRLDVNDLSAFSSKGTLPLLDITDGHGHVDDSMLTVGDTSIKSSSPQRSKTAGVGSTSGGGTKPQILALDTFPSPFDANEHYTLPFGRLPVVVRDNEIGSIIAYGLSSKEYESKRRQLRDSNGMDGAAMSLKMPFFDSNYSTDVKTDSVKNGDTDSSQQPFTDAAQHIELQFQDTVAKFYCKIYYAEHFRMLRKLLFADGEDAFIRSLSRSENWHPTGGKSGASFYRTQDGRFIFKQMSRFEIQSFLKFAPHYFHYVSTAATENKLTVLAKIYGVYRIGFRHQLTNSAHKLDLKNIKQVYDLKGSLRNRMASEKTENELVLLDENLLKDLWQKQLYLHPHSKAALNMAISNDSHFLSAHGVMDYSLLVGVDEDNKELIMGIVDYMRTYTLDKRLESWVKIVAVPGGHLPTVISPEQYCSRFSEAIETYFPVAPDQWTGLGYGIPY